MKRTVLSIGFFAFALLMQPSACANDYPRSVRVSIDAGGKVTALQPIGEDYLFTDLDAQLEKAIRTWTFEPGKVDGKPVATETTLTVNMSLGDLSDDVHVINAVTGMGLDTKATPAYPRRQLERGIEARLDLLLVFDNRARISKLKVEKSATNGKSSDIDGFAASVHDVLPSWHIQPEVVGGHQVPSSASMPVYFCMNECKSLPRGTSMPVTGGTSAIATPSSRVKLMAKVAGLTFHVSQRPPGLI